MIRLGRRQLVQFSVQVFTKLPRPPTGNAVYRKAYCAVTGTLLTPGNGE
jgi:hypothetical protein